jgi:hypothetical protein
MRDIGTFLVVGLVVLAARVVCRRVWGHRRWRGAHD